jgi:biotin carboxylase
MLAVLGSNAMTLPAIRRLQDHGHAVLVVDGNAESPARRVADAFIHQDFSDVNATVDCLRNVPLTGILPLSDFALATAGHVARDRDLPGWTARTESCVRSKVAMKRAWIDAGLPTARMICLSVDDVLSGAPLEWQSWPCIVKPSFSGGGSRGVFLARDWDAVRAGVTAARKKYLDGMVLIEDFIEGTEHTLEVVVHRGEPFLLSISDKENYPGSATVVQNLYFPGPIGHAHRAMLEPLALAGARAIGATDGALHFEILLRHGEPYLLEVGGRPGGGLNFHPICELSTGFDYPGILAAIATGNQPSFQRKPAACLAWHYFPAGDSAIGTLLSIDGFDELHEQLDVVEAEVYETIGQPRRPLDDDLSRPGYVLVRADTIEAARARARHLVNQVQFHVAEPETQ